MAITAASVWTKLAEMISDAQQAGDDRDLSRDIRGAGAAQQPVGRPSAERNADRRAEERQHGEGADLAQIVDDSGCAKGRLSALCPLQSEHEFFLDSDALKDLGRKPRF